jgi:hypothetical protein
MSTPMVEMKALVDVKSKSFSSRHDLPTPESPTWHKRFEKTGNQLERI